MFSIIYFYFKKIINKILKNQIKSEELAYRKYLFNELIEEFSENCIKNKRILEIGPRDGVDTKRFDQLNPDEIIMIDLPDKKEKNDLWVKDIKSKNTLITENILYMTSDNLKKLGKFDLIYCTGVLYHNAEHLKLIKRLYTLLNVDGLLVIESATVRNFLARRLNVVQIWFPETYRDTTTITHLPSKKAIISWLKMAGFENIRVSDCFSSENANLKNIRFASISQKTSDDKIKTYYTKQLKEASYVLGDSS